MLNNMFFLLGVVSVLQIIALPGLIALTLLKINTKSFIQKAVYTFALSMFFNYALVTILVLLSIYTKEVVLSFIFFELILLSYLFYSKKIKFSNEIFIQNFFQFFRSLLIQDKKYKKISLYISFIVLLFYFSLFVANLGTPFYFKDVARLSPHWNTWAMDLGRNILPQNTLHFPQLIPSNWSLTYLLTGVANIQLFPKSFMPLFFLANILIFVDLAVRNKNAIYLLGVITYGLFSPFVYGLVFMADGGGDMAVSFFPFLAFYAYQNRNKEHFITKEYILIFLFASSAAATKLAGFYIFLFASIICLYHLIKAFKYIKFKDLFLIILSTILIVSINLFWHFYSPKDMFSGLNQPQYLAATYGEILLRVLELFYNYLSLPVAIYIVLTIVFSLYNKKVRFLTVIMVIIPSIIWMLKFSSDFRNWSFVIPFISLVSAYGLIKILEILKQSKIDLSLQINEDKNFITKRSLFTIFIVPIMVLLYFALKTDYVFKYFYFVYQKVDKYYFREYRFVNTIDVTLFLHSEYYQNTIATMFLVISILLLLFLLRIRSYYFIIFSIIALITLNFTIFNREDIISHQIELIEKADARTQDWVINNYYLDNKKMHTIYTNSIALSSEKIERKHNYKFLNDLEIYEILSNRTFSGKYLFLHKKYLSKKTLNIFLVRKKEGIPNLYYEDNGFIHVLI